MRYARLVWANLTRNKRRTVLTTLSVAVALFLFATLRSVTTTLDDQVEVGSAKRMITRNAISIVFPVPISYLGRLRAVRGVQSVSWSLWFNGVYIDRRNFFAQFAVDAETYLPMYPEIEMPDEQRRAFLGDMTGAIVGARLMERFGWRLGQTVTLQGTIWPGSWPLTVRAVYHAANPAFGEELMVFHYRYVDEHSGRNAAPFWYVLELSDPSEASAVAETVDQLFRNSRAATKTETERAFQSSFLTMWGNVRFLLRAIGTAIFFAILLVAANTMMMAARERTGEMAVLKTLGFTDRLLAGIVLAEAAAIALTGGLLGVFGAAILYALSKFQAMGFLPGFHVHGSTMAIGLAIAAALGLVSGLVPAWQAARLEVVQALRRVA